MEEEDLKSMSPEQIQELQKQNCIFCKIIGGEIPSKKVYEDDFIEAILDINPAVKGHTLVMPKEHYPILPVIPPNIFKHMFRVSRDISRNIKKGVAANYATIFIANGAVAGQQSPHFLFHIVPREPGDGLFNFDIPERQPAADEISKIYPALKNNLALAIRNQLMREGKVQQPEVSKDDLSEIIEKTPQLKDMILNHPEKLKELMKTNPQLQALFKGINLDALSFKLNEFTRVSKERHEQLKKEPRQNGM